MEPETSIASTEERSRGAEIGGQSIPVTVRDSPFSVRLRSAIVMPESGIPELSVRRKGTVRLGNADVSTEPRVSIGCENVG